MLFNELENELSKENYDIISRKSTKFVKVVAKNSTGYEMLHSYVRVIVDAAGVWLSSVFAVKFNFRPKVD